MRKEETPGQKQARKDFEQSIQYRDFVERHKDGTYKLEWVEARWRGWKDREEYLTALSEPERRERFEALWASRYTSSNWKPCRSHEPGYTHEYEGPIAQQAWVMFNLNLGIRV